MSIKTGPVAANMKIDPTDPDDVGGIAGATGSGYDALAIIDANGTAQRAIRPYTSLPRDAKRSDTLDYDEISEKIDGKKVEGAAVHGSSEENRVVVYLVVSESGRSARGVVSYGGLPLSQAAFDRAESQELDAARAARSAGGSEEDFGEDPRVATLSAAVERLEKEAREKEKAEKEAASKPEEPFEGYDDANADAIAKEIEAQGDPLDRELLKRKVREYEAQGKNRKSVLAAAEPVELVPASEDEAAPAADAGTPASGGE